MAKTGRPKSIRPKFDYGTPELIAKRMMISPRDTTLSTCPLDVMKAKDIISQEAYDAAVYFVGLRKRMFGKAHPSAIDLLAVSGGRPDEADDALAERKYREACAAVRRFGAKTFNCLEDVLIHERTPDWIHFRQSSHWERRLVLLGISALLGWYRERPRTQPA